MALLLWFITFLYSTEVSGVSAVGGAIDTIVDQVHAATAIALLLCIHTFHAWPIARTQFENCIIRSCREQRLCTGIWNCFGQLDNNFISCCCKSVHTNYEPFVSFVRLVTKRATRTEHVKLSHYYLLARRNDMSNFIMEIICATDCTCRAHTIRHTNCDVCYSFSSFMRFDNEWNEYSASGGEHRDWPIVIINTYYFDFACCKTKNGNHLTVNCVPQLLKYMFRDFWASIVRSFQMVAANCQGEWVTAVGIIMFTSNHTH